MMMAGIIPSRSTALAGVAEEPSGTALCLSRQSGSPVHFNLILCLP